MDMQVIYIMLLLVVTIICIGVSAGVKYDKEQITKSSNGIPAHQDDPDYNNIQSDIDTLKNQIATLTANVNQDIKTLVYNEASDIVYTYNNGLVSSSGTPTIHDINTLFQYKGLYATNTSTSTLVPGSDKKSVFKYASSEVGSDANLTFKITESKLYTIQFTESKLYIYMDGTTINGTNINLTAQVSQASSFLVDADGLLKSSNDDYILFGYFYLKLYYATGKGTVGIRLMITNETLTHIKSSSVNQLQYFGLTSATLYPPPMNTNQSILDSPNTDGVITTLKPLRQVLGSSDNTSVFENALNIGLFAKCTDTANDPTGAADVNNATSYTGLGAGDLTDTTNYKIHYITTHFVSNGTLELPSLWLDHTPTIQPKYSIYVVLADENTPNITNFTIKDVNQSKGTQTVVLLGSPYTGDISYYQSLLLRINLNNTTSPISDYGTSEFFSPYGDYNLNNLIFFKFNSDDNGPHSIPAVLDFTVPTDPLTQQEGGWKITTNTAKGQGPLSFIPVSYNNTQNYDLSLADFQNYYLFTAGPPTYTHKKFGGDTTGIINIP